MFPPGLSLSPEFLEPILKAQLGKESFLNLGGFLLGFGLDAALFGMMLVMLGYWVSYVPKERLHVKIILVSSTIYSRQRSSRQLTIFDLPFVLRRNAGLGRRRRDSDDRLQRPLYPVSFPGKLWQMDALHNGQV